ncbi:MAG: hypothetical protein MJ252_09725 [archaeon]|nr:hypothetical protein [archaeon]
MMTFLITIKTCNTYYKKQITVDSAAPKLKGTNVLKAYHTLGFVVLIDPNVAYTGLMNG